jgi:RsiW-degrading membrane proteinase PrsW (M82 family)
VANKKQANPASAFLIMAGFNVAGTIAFLVFYFLYRNSGGENGYYFLIAAAVSGFSSGMLFLLYRFFKKKIEGVRRQ